MARKPPAPSTAPPPGKDDKIEALQGSRTEFVRAWMEAIESARTDEEKWRDEEAPEAYKAYVGDPSSTSAAFNIFHSNMETLLPAVYNSKPIPDVRRRFNDDDKTAAAVAHLIERALEFSIDDYDFDDTVKLTVKDMEIVDRGQARIRYLPTFRGEEETGEEEISYEEVQCEYVPWRSFLHGPARQWKDVPWVAFEHYLSRAEVTKLVSKHPNRDVLLAENGVPFCHSASSKGDEKDMSKEVPKFGARARVWEIWDKDTRQVVFICADYSLDYLAVIKDPLSLRDFFPCPRPAMVIQSTDDLRPVTSYRIYRELLEELNVVTKRITALVGQLRVRGGYARLEGNFKLLSEADDGEFIPLSNAEMFATAGGGLDKAIFFWPIEPIYKCVEALINQREVIKQTIYEVTGLSDIIRGATDANETATAQNIKQQWGSVRVQSHQNETARFCRDLFRLKAEVFCKKFSLQTFFMMTGLEYPDEATKQQAQQAQQVGEQMVQAGVFAPDDPVVAQGAEWIQGILGQPSAEEVEALLKDDNLRRFKVDIESDSTIRGDLTRNQEQMARFLEGFAQFTTSVGPALQEGFMSPKVAVEIASAFVRVFRLGKKAEDALDEWAEQVKGGQAGQGQVDPAMQAEADLKMAQAEKLRAETQLLPQQFEVEKGKADFERDMATSNDMRENDRLDFEKETRGRELANQEFATDREVDFRDRDLDARVDIEGQKLGEMKEARQQSGNMEMLKLKDGRAARMEGYQHAAIPDPDTGQAPPVPTQEPLEEMLTSGEQGRMEQSDALMAQVASGLEQMAQAQAQSTAMLAEAIARLTEAMLAPKELVRDPRSGKAVGVKPVMMDAAE